MIRFLLLLLLLAVPASAQDRINAIDNEVDTIYANEVDQLDAIFKDDFDILSPDESVLA